MSSMPLSSAEFSLPSPPKTIASLDGGGVRAIITARICQKIEECTKQQMADLFDCFAGTSAGAIAALAFVIEDQETKRPKYSAEQVVKFIQDNAATIFPPVTYVQLFSSLFTTKYSPDGLYKVLDDQFGDALLCDAMKEVVIPAALQSKRDEPWLFTRNQIIKNSDEPLISEEAFKKIRMADVLKGTCSAPYYFPAANIKIGEENLLFMDGGTFANNPVSIGLSWARAKYKTTSLLIGSFGTGRPPPEKSQPSYYRSGAFYWWYHYPTTSMELNDGEANLQAAIELNFAVGDMDQEKCLYQFQPQIKAEDYELDDGSAGHIERLLKATEVYIDDNEEMIKKFCRRLLERQSENNQTMPEQLQNLEL